MSLINVNQVDPSTGTILTLGTSGDTVTVPTGVGLTATDEVKTNKISPATGTAFTLGDSGDTFTVPAGATITNSGTATGFASMAPVFQVYLSATQAISHDTATKVALDGEVFDPSGVFASNKFTVATAGYYVINAQIHFGDTNNNLEQFKLMLYVNGAKVRAVDWNDTTDGTMRRATIFTQQLFNFSASDYVELYGLCYANDGTTTGYQFYSDGAECDTSMSAYKLII